MQKPFCCYGCFVGWQVAHGGGDDVAATAFLIRLGVGVFLAMNIMLFSLLDYSGGLAGLDAGLRPYAHGLLWALATPVLVLLGWPFLRETLAELRRGRLAPAILIVTGATTGYGFSVVQLLRGNQTV